MTGNSADLTCRGCGSPDTSRVVDLGAQTGSDHFTPVDDPVPDGRWPLELWLCGDCGLVQLGPIEAQMPEPVRAVESDTSRAHARTTVAAVLAERPELVGGTAFEFASHHGGSWLEHLAAAGSTVVDEGVPAQLVVDVHALAHEQDVDGELAKRAAALREDGLLVLEFHHLLPLIAGSQFDTIRHGHWTYLSLTAVQRLAADQGLVVVSATPEPVFGGSLRLLLAHSGSGQQPDESVARVLAAEAAEGVASADALHALDDRAHESARSLAAYLRGQREAGRRVLAYGAPSKASVLLGVSDVGPDLVEFTVDASPAKHGLSVPGVRVPIRPIEELVAARPDVVLVLTWDIADEVIGQLEARGGWGAEYVVPLPEPHTVER
jgi:hypothetical protein